MRLGMQISYSGDFKSASREVVDLEQAGLDVVWVAEAYTFDAVSQMGYLAAVTDRIQIGAAILPIYSRTPTLMAMTAAGLDFVSDGRFILGLGASGPQVIEGFHGVPYDRPLARTRDIVEICRKVWRRERLEHDGVYTVPLPEGQGTGLGKALKLINRPVRERIPIYIASLGDKNVELTAEIAEGWLPILYIPELAGKVWETPLAAGEATRDPALPPLEIVAGGMVSITDDVDQARAIRDFARPMVALYVGGMGAKGKNFYNSLARKYGFESEAEEIQDLYLAGKKDEAAAKVPDAFLQGTNLVGSEGHVRERLAAFKEAGITTLNVTPVGGDKVKLVESLRSWVDDL
jgi:F420-dependent oxidoreductase-like protein